MKHIALLITAVLLTATVGCNPSKSASSADKHDDHGKKSAEHHDDDHDDHKKDPHDDDHHDDDKKDPHGDDHHDDHDDHHDEEEGVVHLSPEALASTEIALAKATTGVLAGSLELPAEVHLNPDNVAHISSIVEGQLLSVEVSLGSEVKAKQALAKIRSVDLGQARAEYSRAESMRKVAEQTLDRQKRLRAEGINSERSLVEAQLALDQAKAEQNAALSRLRVFGVSQGNGSDMTLTSPIDGVVIERHATRGENISPTTTLFVVADLSRVWIIGRVYEQQVAQVAKGMEATVSLNAYPGRTWTGTVDFVGATLDESTRTLPIRVELDNTDGLLRPGLFGSLRLAAANAATSSVLVPLAAIQTLETRTVVFIPGDEPGEFIAQPVTVGRESKHQAEIIAGLDPDASVVVKGAFILKSEIVRGQLGDGHAH